MNNVLASMSALGFLMASVGGDIAARVMRLDAGFGQAFLEVIASPAGGWPLLILSALPFAGVYSVTQQVWIARGARGSVVLMIVLTIALALVYLDSYLAYQDALRDRQWTGASLGIGLLFLKGFAVVLMRS